MGASRSVRDFISIAVLMMATSVGAAGLDELKDTTPAERAMAQTFMMKQKLGLSDEQTPKVKTINEKYAEQMDPVIKGSEGPLMKMRSVKEIEERKEAELKDVLSSDQFQQFQSMKAEMKDKLMERVKEQRAQKAK